MMRTRLIDTCVGLLSVYRKHCTASASPGQLVLPEALKLVPIYMVSLMKNVVIRSGSDVNPDERAHLMLLVNSASMSVCTSLIYPRLYALHQIPVEVGRHCRVFQRLLVELLKGNLPPSRPQCGTVDEDGNVQLPPMVRLSREELSADGAFLLENGQKLVLWLGRSLAQKFVADLFGVDCTVDFLNVQEVRIMTGGSSAFSLALFCY